MWIGTLALGRHSRGFAGFYSKDAILEAAWAAHSGGRHLRLLAAACSPPS